LEWAHVSGATHFIYASTGGLYGLGSRLVKETDPVNITGRLTYYYSTKYAAEIMANAYRDCLTIVTLRYFFIYGTDQRSSMLVPRLIHAICNDRPVTLVGTSGMRLNPINVRDAAAAAIAALAVNNCSTFNVAGPDVVSMRELAQIIGDALGRTVVFKHVAVVERQDLMADISTVSACLGAPRIGIKEGIADICKAFVG
jgi:UDP-glucose 4-epimerase